MALAISRRRELGALTLTSFPPWIASLTFLEDLGIPISGLTVVPFAIFQPLTRLTRLDLNLNPVEVVERGALTTAIFDNLSVMSRYGSVGDWTHLVFLHRGEPMFL